MLLLSDESARKIISRTTKSTGAFVGNTTNVMSDFAH